MSLPTPLLNEAIERGEHKQAAAAADHAGGTLHVANAECQLANESRCLLLGADNDSKVSTIQFRRGAETLDEDAAKLLGVPADHVRCLSVPKSSVFGCALHIYLDLKGVEHGLSHNTNATQLWLIANLPEEPPHVLPDAIHGPVLISGADISGSDLLLDLSVEDWEKIKEACRKIQPSAIFIE